MLKAKTRWKLTPFDQEIADLLAEGLKVSPLVAKLLVNRGYTTIETATKFLQIETQEFHDPFLLHDMEKAVARINHAICNNEKILIFGDYDADGVSSTTIMLSTLESLDANVDFYIPNRFTEGYGPNKEAFNWAKSENFSLIITVDTGIAALDEAIVAKQLGMDLIITDHHEPGPALPEAFAIIHPKKLGCPYPFKDLAGVGVAFKFAHAMLGECPTSLLEIAAIGTIADLVPLTGENRLIAKRGIEQLKQTKRVGLKALLKLSGVETAQINEETIGFTLGPRINAVGRLDSADPAVHLLMTDDPEEAESLAELIDSFNKERQKIVNQITDEAIKEVEENYPLETNNVLVIGKEGWNPGVIGIVASKLVDRFYRPVIVLGYDAKKNIAKGSARSIAGFDMFKHLSTCRDILPHFGGHPMAAGMTLNLENVNDLRTRLNEIATEVLQSEDFIPITSVDAKVQLDEISIDMIEQIEKLAPFGMCNPKPKVIISDVGISNIRKIGSNQTHIKISFERNGLALDSVGFGFGYLFEEISQDANVNVLGELSINEWNNFRKPQLFIQDISIDEWQLFDYRGVKEIGKAIHSIPINKRKLVVFHEETISLLQLEKFENEILQISSLEAINQYNFCDSYVVFIDLPPSEEFIQVLLADHFPERIYTFFFNNENHFFSTIPTRDHFKWLYAILVKKGPIDMAKNAEAIAKYRGWTKETIDFMIQVFFELDFVKIENGLISLLNNKNKRDFQESKTYRQKQLKLDLENMYLYSSYHQLKEALKKQAQLIEVRN